jgi:hypothetical protein
MRNNHEGMIGIFSQHVLSILCIASTLVLLHETLRAVY